MNGGEFMSADGRKVTLNDPNIVGALDWMTRVYDRLGGAKSVYAFQSSFQGGDLDPFITGKVAMKIDGVWVLDSMAQYARQMNWGAAPPPLPQKELDKGKKTVSWVGGWCYAVPSTAKEKDAAWALIRFLSSPEANEIMNESQRLTAHSQGRAFVPRQHPNRKINDWLTKKYVDDDPNTDPQVRKAVHVFNDLLSESRYRPVTMVGQLLWNQHITAMENGIFHNMHPASATKLFKKICGMSLMTYITQHRIFHAQRLLFSSDMKIIDVALESGYQSASRFYAAFKEHCGVSPQEFRRSVKTRKLPMDKGPGILRVDKVPALRSRGTAKRTALPA